MRFIKSYLLPVLPNIHVDIYGSSEGVIYFSSFILILMKSIKYRKLMQGLGTLVQKQPESFSMTVSPGVTCECSL